jgi:hypothetical protein
MLFPQISSGKTIKVSSSSERNKTRQLGGPNSTTNTNEGPSKERLARILSVCEDGIQSADIRNPSDQFEITDSDDVTPTELENLSTLSGDESASTDEKEDLQLTQELSSQISEDEEALRRSVRDVFFPIQEDLTTQHMQNVQKHAELLAEELMTMKKFQGRILDEDEMESYSNFVEDVLRRKEILMDQFECEMKEFIDRLA